MNINSPNHLATKSNKAVPVSCLAITRMAAIKASLLVDILSRKGCILLSTPGFKKEPPAIIL